MMIRTRPLETEQVTIRAKTLTVPTLPETLRVKAWLAVRCNQTRDYIDIAALSDKLGIGESAQVLAAIDEFYEDVNLRPQAVATQVARQLSDPCPRDSETTSRLAEYKALDERWHDWAAVTDVLADVASLMVEARSP